MKYLSMFLVSVILCYQVDAQEFDGLWKTRGYGFAFHIEDSAVNLFDVTTISSIPSLTGTIKRDSFFLDGSYFGDFVRDSSQFSLQVADGNIFKFDAIDSLTNPIAEITNDPFLVFDVLWQTHQEHSALLSILDIDWTQVRDSLRPFITDSTNNEALFGLLASMLEPLNDGHSVLVDFDGGAFFTGGPELNPFFNPEDELGQLTIFNIISNYLNGEVNFTESEFIAYGVINDSIGYINVGSMSGYGGEDANDLEDNAAFELEIREAFEAVKDLPSLILDIRFNGGGSDLLGRTLAEFFTTEERLAYTKQARNGEINEFVDSIPFFIKPKEITYFEDKPILVLTSQYTASAAEILTLCLNQIPNLTTLGEATNGIFSDAIPKVLPNGWLYTISVERYLSSEGINYEQLGIPPDIEVLTDSAGILNGGDNMLDRAILELTDMSTSITEAPFLQGESIVYPNPFTHQLTISFQLAQNTPLSFSMYTLQGQLIQQIPTKLYQNGTHALNWNTAQLPSGTYHLHISSEEEELHHLLIKQ